MKLLCINNKLIEYMPDEKILVSSHAAGLKEGEIYSTIGKSYKNKYGKLCYYIDGLGQKLACRFTQLLDDESNEEKSIESLKREFQLN